MKKSITFPVSRATAVAQYGYTKNADVVLVPLEIDLDALSDAGRVIAENVETFDRRDDLSSIHVSGPSHKELAIAKGTAQEEIDRLANIWGEGYTNPLIIPWSFGLLRRNETPERFIERNVEEMRKAGARVITRGWRGEINYSLID